MRILFYPTDPTIQKEKREWKWIWISLRHCFERDVHVVAGSLTCTCTPVVDVSFVQAAPWFPGLWVASDWQRPCGVLSDGAPAINRSRCVTNLSALSTNFGMCCFFVEHALLRNIIYRSVFGDFVTARPLYRLYRALFKNSSAQNNPTSLSCTLNQSEDFKLNFINVQFEMMSNNQMVQSFSPV